jgi:thiol-disulfide isomerase/thioredoxin
MRWSVLGVAQAALLTLTEETFDEVVASTENLLLAFTATETYCEWCAEYEEVLVEAAQFLEPRTMVGKIDGKVATNLAKEFRVQDFPTLFFYTSKQFHWYDGPGDLEGMLKWVDEALAPIEQVPEVPPAVEKGRLTIVGDHLPDIFVSMSRSVQRRFKPAFVNTKPKPADGETATEGEGEDDGEPQRGRIVLQHLHEAPVELEAGWTDADLEKFMEKYFLPLVGEITGETSPEYALQPKVVWVLADMGSAETLAEHVKALRPTLTSAAQEAEGWRVTVLDTKAHGNLTQDIIGVHQDEFAKDPVVVAIKDNSRFKHTGPLTELADFLKRVDDGKVWRVREPWSAYLTPVDVFLYSLSIAIVVWSWTPTAYRPEWMRKADYVLYKNVVRVKIAMRRNLPDKIVKKMDGWGLFHIF